MTAPSIVDKGPVNYSGLTWGGRFESDGIPTGTDQTQEVVCNGGTCGVSVPAPAIAIVFLSDTALANSGVGPSATAPKPFTTTYVTKTRNTATVPPSELATSNGQGGTHGHVFGASSVGGKNAGERRTQIVGVVVATAGVLVGLSLVFWL